VGDETFHYFNLQALNDPRLEKLPFSIRVLLESAVRNCDDFNIKRKLILLTLCSCRRREYSELAEDQRGRH
jgi:aconitase A